MLSAAKGPHMARRAEQGYILLMMMLFVTLLAIAAMALAPSMAFKVRREREEEMIHRGVQYSRAIRRYVKKFGRYPTRIEELENTNNVRFLRKRYKDPITGEDFKLLHVGDVQLTGSVGLAGATPAAAAVAAAAGSGGALGANMRGGAAAQAAQGALIAATVAASAGSVGGAATNPTANPSPDKSQDDATSSDDSETKQAKREIKTDSLSGQTFGGGPIVGVASTSKLRSIREFNHKNHYNQWQFIYDPSMDRGGLITTPAQPPLQVSQPLNQQQNSAGTTNTPGTMSTPGGLQTPPPVQPIQQQQ